MCSVTGPVTGETTDESMTQLRGYWTGETSSSAPAAATEPPAAGQAGGGERVEIKNAALAGWVRSSLVLDKSQLSQLAAGKESGYGQSKQAPLYLYLLQPSLSLELFFLQI